MSVGKLEGNVAVITGGMAGIGPAAAKLFVAEGAYVFITGHHQDKLDDAVTDIGGNVCGVQGNVAEEHFDKTFSINVKGTLFTVQKSLPLLNDGGSIIFAGSAATVKETPAFAVYSASKAAIRNFVRGWAVEVKDQRPQPRHDRHTTDGCRTARCRREDRVQLFVGGGRAQI